MSILSFNHDPLTITSTQIIVGNISLNHISICLINIDFMYQMFLTLHQLGITSTTSMRLFTTNSHERNIF